MFLRLLAPLTLAAMMLAAPGRGDASEPRHRTPVVDARGAAAFAQGHLPGAQLYAWQAFTGEGAARGRLRPEPRQLAQALSALGVDTSRPALIYGAAGDGWGEEGHAAWLLAYLGHGDVALLDGGFAAWQAAGRPVVTSTTQPHPGRFELRLRRELRADRDEVARAKQLVDVRSSVEFHGATPCGEVRGGRIRGARHLDWRALLDESGRILPGPRLLRQLADAGIDPEREVVAYCTCGVRSAFATVVLTARGVPRVRNYDASLAEWANDLSLPMER